MTGQGRYTHSDNDHPISSLPVRADRDALENSPFESALSQTGYGWFHYLLFVLLGGTYVATAMEASLVSFVIPSAKCDFKLTSEAAGLLTALPMLGMTAGSFFWGLLADLGGRRWVLGSSLLLGGFAGLLSSIAQYFTLFLALRFINGFALVGALGICIPYLSEFQPLHLREKIICWMEICWTAGIIAIPCLAWMVIPLQMRYDSKLFRFDSWNLFVAASATPCLLLGIASWYIPESPKFLFEIGEYEQALDVLRKIFQKNTGKPQSSFPVYSLEEKGVSILGGTEGYPGPRKRNLRSLAADMGTITKTLFKAPYLNKTLLTCSISFSVTSSYYTLMMWFPELFTRFEAFALLHPGQDTSVCEVSSVFLQDVPSPLDCHSTINSQVFLNTIIVGLSCIPTSLWLPLSVHWLGTKFFLIFCLGTTGLVAIGMFFVTSSTQNLVLSCLFEALTSLGLLTLYIILVEIFPTSVRVMATGLTIGCGRLGALLGNLTFGYMIDLNCTVPILIISVLLLSNAVLSFFLPVKMKPKVISLT